MLHKATAAPPGISFRETSRNELRQRVLDLEAQLLTQTLEIRRIARERELDHDEHRYALPHVTETTPWTP